MIGASPRRKEDRRLLVGVGRFVDDLAREGLLHLAVVRSVQAHARIAKIALAEARALRGVVAAWSAADLPETARPMPSAYGAVRKGRPWSQPILARDRVRYVGEPVAVVVAESPYRVADALELVRVEYEPLPALTTVEAALASPTRLHDGWPDNAALAVGAAIGDAERALATADIVIHETFRHPRLAAVPIEPRGVLAYRDRDSGALVVWSSCQNPYSVRDIVAAALELSAEAVRVVVPDVGGAFGPKGSVYPEEVLVAAAALRLGRPVKWIETRREDFASLGHDREQTHEARIASASIPPRSAGATSCAPTRCRTGRASRTRTASRSPTIRAISRAPSSGRSPFCTTPSGDRARRPRPARHAASAWASRATRRAPGSAPTRARRCAWTRAARYTSSSGSRRRARGTRPRSPRSPRRSSAPRSMT